jgi:hypothetical protein
VIAALLAEASEPESMARAKELLDLVKSPTAIATGVLLVFAKQQLKGNGDGIRRWPTFWAGVAALGAIVLTATIVGVMTPLAARTVFVNRGGVETRLLVYGLTWIVAVGTTIYSATVLIEVVKEYSRGKEAHWQ